MSDLALEQVIKKYLSTEQPLYTFGWQGGEPTLMGIKFFKRITELQKKHARPGSQIANALQTNATLIDHALAEHLARYRFLVGCSLDGPPELHNRYRRYVSGRPSHASVLKGIETLRRHRVEFNILVLVSKANVHRRFGSRKSEVHSDCRNCNFFDLCLGDCLKHRKKKRMQTAAISHLCTGWEEFFAHSRQSFNSLAQKLRYNHIVQKFGHQSVIPNKKLPSVGRNQPCPCGSGKKFKKCCGR